MNFLQKIIRENAYVYCYWLHQNTPDASFLIVEIDRAKHASFQRAIKASAPLDFRDYGTIHYHKRHEPSLTEKQHFHDKFALFRDEFEG